MAITMGIDIGQKRDHSALCVAESVTRKNGDRSAVHHLVRHLERLPLATPFPDVAARAGSVAAAIDRRVRCSPEIFIDATGVGMPVVDLVREAVAAARAVTPVFFTHGDRRTVLGTPWHPEVQLGKAYLVSRLQTLLQSGRLHLPRTAEAETLACELLDIRDPRRKRRQRPLRGLPCRYPRRSGHRPRARRAMRSRRTRHLLSSEVER